MNLAQKLIRLLMLMWQRWSTISTGYKQEKILKRPEKDVIKFCKCRNKITKVENIKY